MDLWQQLGQTPHAWRHTGVVPGLQHLEHKRRNYQTNAALEVRIQDSSRDSAMSVSRLGVHLHGDGEPDELIDEPYDGLGEERKGLHGILTVE